MGADDAGPTLAATHVCSPRATGARALRGSVREQCVWLKGMRPLYVPTVEWRGEPLADEAHNRIVVVNYFAIPVS